MSAYNLNRTGKGERTRMVVNLPPTLVDALDRWGVSSGKTSRREAAEQLLRDALEAKGVRLEKAS